MSRSLRVENVTKRHLLAEQAELADHPWRRLKGLLGRAGLRPGEALVLRPCQGVHTWFMTFPIDVLYVDAHSVVRRILADIPPNRFGLAEIPAMAAIAIAITCVDDRLAGAQAN